MCLFSLQRLDVLYEAADLVRSSVREGGHVGAGESVDDLRLVPSYYRDELKPLIMPHAMASGLPTSILDSI